MSKTRQSTVQSTARGYYATFFFDPDGTKLEVTFTPE